LSRGVNDEYLFLKETLFLYAPPYIQEYLKTYKIAYSLLIGFYLFTAETSKNLSAPGMALIL
jgi:hypothetical protein